ncbi:MAG: hypothetical protein IJ588_01520 [Prevotella sp.]|nr:hypothetical protein [Prevotella sp.]
MEELFNEESLNRSMEEIEQMCSILRDKENFIRECIRNYVSRLLMDTSEEKHVKMEACLYEDEAYGLTSSGMPWVTQIWQHPSEGIITTTIDDEDFDPDEYEITTVRESCRGKFEIDFDDYSTKEQMEILRELVWTLNNR